MSFPTTDDLIKAILDARKRVYEVATSTPLERMELEKEDAQLYLKREDLSPIHAYKWRGSYNRMCLLSQEERNKGVVCASAGNHAQGVALAAQKLNTHASIYMPRSTPQMKISSVERIGGDAITIHIEGNSYDEAFALASKCAETEDRVFVHAYNDLHVIAGQGTLADEVVMAGTGEFDIAYLQIGGGGMAAGVACWLKHYYPNIEIVGVEGVDQASMAHAVRSGSPSNIPYLDVFCDGTAVRMAGDLTHHFCKQLIDRFITVTNDEVCSAIQTLWEAQRTIPEPAGAMGVAGWRKEREHNLGKKALAVICGANMDFGQLSWVVKHAGIGSARRKFYRFSLEERPGTLLNLLSHFPENVNIVEFQHGLTSNVKVEPVIGIDATAMEMAFLEDQLNRLKISFQDATNDEDVEFRIIHYNAVLFQRPLFLRIEFHERPGALTDFLRGYCREASIIYFNYGYTGERVGRALIGFDFASDSVRHEFVENVLKKPNSLRYVKKLQEDVIKRIGSPV